jgi:hypothetical protein
LPAPPPPPPEFADACEGVALEPLEEAGDDSVEAALLAELE